VKPLKQVQVGVKRLVMGGRKFRRRILDQEVGGKEMTALFVATTISSLGMLVLSLSLASKEMPWKLS